MRELVSARNLVLELKKNTGLDLKEIELVSKVWEDNVGTQNIANSKGCLISSRTKHIGIKYHWFRSKVQPNKIENNQIVTKEKKVDLFTKGLTRFELENKRS